MDFRSNHFSNVAENILEGHLKKIDPPEVIIFLPFEANRY